MPGEIIVGGNYVMMALDKKSTTKPKSVTKVSPKPTPSDMSPEKPLPLPPYTGLTKTSWSKPKSIEQAQAWCADRGIAASFPDIETAVAVTTALSESHPYVIKHVQFVGTPEQLKVWAKANPEIAKKSKGGKHSLDLAKDNPLGSSAAAVAHPIGSKPYTMSAIVVTPSYWSKSGVSYNKAKAGGLGVGDTVRHELGHVEAFVMRHVHPSPETPKRSMWQVWKDQVVPVLQKNKAQLMSDISQYGGTNPHEAWAELSVLRRRGAAMPGWVQNALLMMKVDTHSWGSMMPANPFA